MKNYITRSIEMRDYLLPTTLAALGLLVPAVAVADNECGVQQQPGAAETVTCAPGDYAGGITYQADGDLTVQVPLADGDLQLNAAGASVSAVGSDGMAWDSGLFTNVIRGSDGAILDFTTEAGAIDVVTNRITGSGTASHGIRASSVSGDIDITAGGAIGGVLTGIEATSISGDISLDIAGTIDVPGAGTPNHAIRASTQQGDIDLVVRGSVNDRIALDTTGGAGAISMRVDGALIFGEADLRTGTGALQVDLQPGAFLDRATLRTETGGDAVITLHQGVNLNRPSRPMFDLNPGAGTQTTLNLETLIDSRVQSGTSNTIVVLRGGGAGRTVIHNRAGIHGSMDFSSNSGGVTFHNYGASAAHPEAVGLTFLETGLRFGSGDDVVRNEAGAQIISGIPRFFDDRDGGTPEAVIVAAADFGAGNDRWVNDGVLVVGETTVDDLFNSDPQAFQLNLIGLETFENSGLIILGGVARAAPHLAVVDDTLLCDYGGPCIDRYGRTDGEFSDVLSMPGTHYVGQAGSQILLDAALGLGLSQANCTDRAGRAGMWRLPGADCVDLTGGSTEGVTEIVVHERFATDAGAHNPDGLVVVDVSGGSSAAGHFVLSPESELYNPALNALDKGLFHFPLVYDEETQQHKLLGLPGHRAYQMPLLVQSTQAIGRAHSQTWLGRQADRRTTVRDRGTAAENAIWGGITQSRHSREPGQHSGPTQFRNDYDQDITTVQAGVDWLHGGDGRASWVVGTLFGYANSQVDFTEMGTQAEFDGVTAGVYAGYQGAAFFWDALLTGNWVQMDYDDIAFSDPTDPFDALKTQAQNIGVEAEAGWRLSWSEAYIEPLIGLSWARPEFDTMTILSKNVGARPGNQVFGDNTPSSFRGAVGARAGLQQTLGSLRADYRLTARFWNEFQGETAVRIRSIGPDLVVDDTFDSALSEIALGVGLGNAGGTVSGHLQVDGTFGDDYDSFGMTAGFRYQW